MDTNSKNKHVTSCPKWQSIQIWQLENLGDNCSASEMVCEVFYEKCLSAIAHVLDEVKTKVVNVDYVKFWFLLLTKKR